MSTIKSSDEHLTLNADGSSKDIKLQSNASEKVIVKSDGKVGIGTSSPSENLHVKTSTGDAVLRIENGSYYNRIDQNSIGSTQLLTFKTGGSLTERMRIDSSGNVGIGTSPSYKLHTLIGAGEANGVGILNTSGQGLNIYTDSTAANADVSIDQGATGGAIIFRQNGTERLRIAGNGAVTMPSQPAFQAFGSVGNQDIDPSSSWNTIVLGTERFDNNADFSANTFTAPVTGKYQLNALVYLLNADSAANYSEIQIKTSNKAYQAILSTNQFNGDLNYLTLMASALADMDANDTAYVQVNIGGGAAQTDVSSGTVFSGYLVC